MAVITLKELVSLNKQRSSPLANFQTSELSRQQQQFQLLVRQKRMGLNIESLLDCQLALLLEQLSSFIPGIFEPRKKIYLDTRWKARLQIGEAYYWLEVPINAGVVKNKVRLYEWRIGSVEPNWCDCVKLWVACQFLQYQPQDLLLVICAFSPEHNGCVEKIRFSKKDYCEIEGKLKSLLRKDTSKAVLKDMNTYSNHLTNIDEIEEIKL